ncbi:HNH endonuclease signature motif containing protein [Nocardioides taihuensis]|uniref:HNH endonuclease signature motif containing protein n=1 Tax=Nocardioides taihuensis TaxID=1835606 RepID=A0ABW0BRD5_9ACTN
MGRVGTTHTPVTADTIRTWCGTADHLVIKPVIDLHDHIHVDAYEVPDRIKEHLTLRDHTCVFPWCTRPAQSCDTDHVHPFESGGETSTDNTAPLCRRHHRAKAHGRWKLTALSPGSYLWRTPHGLHLRRDHTGTTLLPTSGHT